jgi:hypothetical protein
VRFLTLISMLELILLCSGEKFMYKQNIIAKGKNLHINNSLCEERIRVSNDFTGKKISESGIDG